jgi:hypothetical protein
MGGTADFRAPSLEHQAVSCQRYAGGLAVQVVVAVVVTHLHESETAADTRLREG